MRRATSVISISRWGVTEEVGKTLFNNRLIIMPPVITDYAPHQEILDLLAKDGKVLEEVSSSSSHHLTLN